jgi:hypothetical protein
MSKRRIHKKLRAWFRLFTENVDPKRQGWLGRTDPRRAR